MKITDISVVVHERHLPNGMPLPPMEMAVLRIHTDEGIEGNTFISPPGPKVTDQILQLHAPTRPGLGYDIDWELIDASRVAELR